MKKGTGIATLYKLFKLCKGLRGEIILTGTVVVLSSFLSIYPIKYIEEAINISVNSLTGEAMKKFLMVGAMYLVLHVLNVFFNGVSEYLNVKLETKIGHKVRVELFSKLQNMKINFYDDAESGDLLVKLMQDSTITIDGILKPVIFILKELSIFIIGFYYMAKIDIGITITIIPIGILLSFFITKTGPKIHLLCEKEREATSSLWGKFNELVRGIKEIKSYRQEKNSLDRISKLSLNVNKRIISMQRYSIITESINSAFFMAIICLIIVLGGYKVGIGALSIGGLSAMMMYNGLLVDPMLNFTSFYQETQRVLVSIERIFSILDIDEEENTNNTIKEKSFKDKLEVRNLSFGYKDKKTLKEVSLVINKGDKVAFVGESGSGKSTMCKLFMRFYDVDAGNIILDNKDIRSIEIDKIRSVFGIVFQETFLFSSTIRENLLFAKPEATEEELNNAIEISGMNLFLNKLPERLDTYIGENGLQLSGGERQRISIARIILKNPEIVILDEATSALDSITTAKIIKDLLDYFKDKTIIFTVHKLTSIAKVCHRIYLYENGEIIEEGSHDELMSKKAKYNKLYSAQFVQVENDNKITI